MNCSFDFAAGRTDGNFCGRRRRGRGPADGALAAAAAVAKIETNHLRTTARQKKIGSGRPDGRKKNEKIKVCLKR